MNCDRIAPIYRFLEYGSFGTAMRSTRYRFLPLCRHAKKVLLLGDGDGRFLRRFLRENPTASVDSVDNSAGMLRLAASRLPAEQKSQVNFHRLDVLRDDLPGKNYGLVVTNFFLDCFCEEDMIRLVGKISACCRDDASWLVSEFREPEHGWRRLRARLWVGGLYTAFRFATGLEANRLPDYASPLTTAGFTLSRSHTRNAGLLVSEIWIRNRDREDPSPSTGAELLSLHARPQLR